MRIILHTILSILIPCSIIVLLEYVLGTDFDWWQTGLLMLGIKIAIPAIIILFIVVSISFDELKNKYLRRTT